MPVKVASARKQAGDTAALLPFTSSRLGVGLAMPPAPSPPLAAPLVVFSPAAADGAKNSVEQGSGGSALDFPEVYWCSGLMTPVQAT